jgi:mannose-6-phosphate isomerase-like protein (cupin superfamily)
MEGTMSQSSTVNSSPAVHLGQDDGEAFRLGPLEIVVKENGSGTRMNLAVAEFRGDTFRIPPHVHTEHDETIYVLEGGMGVKLGDRTFTATAGSSFTIPVNVPHAIWNESGGCASSTSSSPRATSTTSARWLPPRPPACRRQT